MRARDHTHTHTKETSETKKNHRKRKRRESSAQRCQPASCLLTGLGPEHRDLWPRIGPSAPQSGPTCRTKRTVSQSQLVGRQSHLVSPSSASNTLKRAGGKRKLHLFFSSALQLFGGATHVLISLSSFWFFRLLDSIVTMSRLCFHVSVLLVAGLCFLSGKLRTHAVCVYLSVCHASLLTWKSKSSN